jgi:hypothetical protein
MSWHRVDPADVPQDGRVRSVVVDGRTVALSRCGAGLGALENRCPHQGGPLGEGAIGDGGFGQYATELTYGIPIKHVLSNNNALGKISKEQPAEDYPVWHTSLHNPGWAAYARICGASGIRVDRRDQAMPELFTTEGPALLCVEQDAELL